jgi:hypothetical protein
MFTFINTDLDNFRAQQRYEHSTPEGWNNPANFYPIDIAFFQRRSDQNGDIRGFAEYMMSGGSEAFNGAMVIGGAWAEGMAARGTTPKLFEQSGAGAEERGGPYGHLEDPASAGPGKNFTRVQKQKILSENESRNGGVLRDDRSGENLVRPKQSQKGVTPPANEAHVDHVYPRSKDGPNTYSNAEVRSRANNIGKSNKIEE